MEKKIEKKTKYNNGGIGSRVEAIYTDAVASVDKGNKLIECLSEEISDFNELSVQYSKDIADYNDEQRKLPKDIRRQLIYQIKSSFRVTLPFCADLEHEFTKALTTSYRARKDGYTSILGESKPSTVANSLSSTAGFVMISHSGCGKSTAIESLLSHHPQVYIHKNYNDDLDQKVQISYIYVQTYPNSNFNALLDEIGAKIDEALGVSEYEQYIARTRGGIAAKTRALAKLIEVFSIGAIIFDEIQNINFDSTKENSIENLLTLNNMTKVALIMVGTEDAYKKMPQKYRFKRRLGTEIPADTYCSDKEYIKFILSKLFKYQWTEEKITLTNSMVDTFIEETHGIIDQIISLYIFVQEDWIKSNRKGTIDSEYIKKVSRKYYPGLKELLEKEETLDTLKRIQVIKDEAQEKYYKEINTLLYNKNSKTLIEVSKKQEIENRVQSVISKIKIFYDDYSDDVIAECAKNILNKNIEIDDTELARTVMETLRASKKKHSSNVRITNKALAQNLNLINV